MMNNYGIVRPIDKLGRIVIPKEYRKMFEIKDNDMLEIIACDEGLLIRIPKTERIFPNNKNTKK